jgi:hypothetical protein
LADYQHLKYHNSHYTYILCAIDVFSRQARCEPLKSKRAATVLPALRKIISSYPMTVWAVYCDLGGEFKGSVKEWLEATGIKFIQLQNPETKAAECERFIKTLKMRLHRHMTLTNKKRWVDILPRIVDAYNASYHRSIKRAPRDITQQNEHVVWRELYGKKKTWKRHKYALGERVRVKIFKGPLEKSYTPSFSQDIYVITEQVPRQPPSYRLKTSDQTEVRAFS